MDGMNRIEKRAMLQLAFTCLLLLSSGPFERDMKDREKLEAQTAFYLTKGLTAFANAVPGVKLTNTLQLFHYADTNIGIWGYPYWHEHCFRKFHKKDSGFTNSVLEKYVVVQPGIQVPLLRGELVLLNAQPYRNREKKLERMLICKTDEGFVPGPYPEEHLQQLFEKAGQKIPSAVSLPQPPPGPPIIEHKPRLTVEYMFKQLAVAMGFQESLWLTFLFIAVMVVITAFFLILFVSMRRGAKR